MAKETGFRPEEDRMTSEHEASESSELRQGETQLVSGAIVVSDPEIISGIVLILLVNLARAHWAWGWQRIAFGRWSDGEIAGLRFSKIMGSGKNGGFGLTPSPSHQGMFCVFDSQAHAQAFIDDSPLMARYRASATEFFCATLRIGSVRGSWDGLHFQSDISMPAKGPIATLTRASIRPLAAASFWRKAPAAQKSLHKAAGCDLAVGLGEAPLLRQATFSIWRDTDAMMAYAHTGAHQDAIKAAWQQDFFSESMFMRFVPLTVSGSWRGRTFD